MVGSPDAEPCSTPCHGQVEIWWETALAAAYDIEVPSLCFFYSEYLCYYTLYIYIYYTLYICCICIFTEVPPRAYTRKLTGPPRAYHGARITAYHGAMIPRVSWRSGHHSLLASTLDAEGALVLPSPVTVLALLSMQA